MADKPFQQAEPWAKQQVQSEDAMNIESLLSRLPRDLEIPTFHDMKMRTDGLRRCAKTQVRQVGEDRFGEPIDMISLGEGANSILVIGAPHPNEPVGCIGIEWLIEQLRQDDRFRLQSGLAWHFIKAIEPYALMQNQGWFNRPDLASYFAGFYRPAFKHQAEYAFPLLSPATGTFPGTPENAAYRQAIALARPDLLASLHGADCGGAFYFLSQDDRILAQALSSQPARRGLTLNQIGEGAPGVEDVSLAPGVFLAAAAAPGQNPLGLSVGSVVDYLAEVSQPTVTLIPEVPLFAEPRLAGGQGKAIDFDRIAAESWGAQVVELLEPFVDRLAENATALEALYADAIKENLGWADELLTIPDASAKQLTTCEFASHLRLCRMVGLRPVAMAGRLAAMRLDRATTAGERKLAGAAQEATRAYMYRALADRLMHNRLAPTPLQSLVANQIEAILTASTFVPAT